MKIFKDNDENEKDFGLVSSTEEEDSPMSPSRKIKKVKKLDTVNFEAANHIYTATTTRFRAESEFTMKDG